MSHLPSLTLVAVLSLLAAPAAASSTTSSVSSEGSSASVGSVSGSIETSSDSSSRTVVAAGPYRVIEVAAPASGGDVRVRLQALDGGREFVLRLPPAAAEQARLAAGDRVTVSERPYGLQFARADASGPFFLVLDDAAWRELQSRPVAL